MSFSTVTKNELARITGQHSCCRLAELAALVKMDGSIQIGRGQVALNIINENAAVARKIFSLVKNVFGLQTEVLVQRKNRLRKNNIYLVRILPRQEMSEILKRLGMVDKRGQLQDAAPGALIRRKCCRRAYLRGAFLGGGSVNSPSGTYHLEVITERERLAQDMCRMMKKFHLNARVSQRKNWCVVYLKESEQIVNFLSIIGAHAARLKFEDIRIYKNVRNQVNRLVNCETANLNKTVNAALRQVDNIILVRDTVGWSHIPESLRETAELRLKYPDASLRELGDMMRPRLGKSGVNHRLRKLDDIAEKVRAGKL